MDLFLRELLRAAGCIIGLLIIFVVTRYVIPWLKTKLGESKYIYILSQVQEYMCAIEERSDLLTGEQKAEWVTDQIMTLFPKLNREYVRALIDGSMRYLTQEGLVNYQAKHQEMDI